MNKPKSKRKTNENDLTVALDKTIEAAVALGISEVDLASRLSKRIHIKTENNILQLYVEPQRKMYNAEAGP